jgi:hypothetical protein
MSYGYVRLRCDDPPLDVTALLGADPVAITAGFGGWEVTARPRQVGMTTWQGVEPFQMSLPLMFDGWSSGVSQETALGLLLTVARGDKDSEPGVLHLSGIPLPAHHGWVIEGIDYGDVIVDPASGARLRQALTLTLREYVEPKFLRLKKGARQKARRKTRVITAKKGDTPAKIARAQKCKWTDLRELNPKIVKKANQTLKAGTKLRAPVAVAHHTKLAARHGKPPHKPAHPRS